MRERKRAAEKRKRERLSPVRTRAYTETHQSEKRKRNETAKHTLVAFCGSVTEDSAQKSILPPSKLFMGSKLSRAKERDTVVKKERESLPRSVAPNRIAAQAEMPLQRGPLRQMKHSLP